MNSCKKILERIDQYSPEQISNLINQMTALQKYVDSLSQELQQIIKEDINNLNAAINQKIDQEIENTQQKSFILEFKAALLDYLNQGENINSLFAKQYEINWDSQTEQLILLFINQLFNLETIDKWVQFVNLIESGNSFLSIPADSVRASLIRETYIDIIKKQSLVNECTRPDAFFGTTESIICNHVLIANGFTLERYFTSGQVSAKRILDSLVGVLQINNFKNIMGSNFFSHDEIQNHFQIESYTPCLPSSLTAEVLNSSCPFESGKKVFETHFLFSIPAATLGQNPFSWEAFVQNLSNNKFQIHNDLNFWTSIDASDFTYKDPTGYPSSNGNWVLLYANNCVSNVPSGYQLVSVQQMITALTFWRYLETDPQYLYNLWPCTEHGVNYVIKDYEMDGGSCGVNFGPAQYSNAGKIVVKSFS